MKRLIACVAIASTLSCTRLGDMLGQIEQFVAVASLVDNVSYLPLAAGRRTPDSAQITTIGPEVSSIEVMFLDALTPASIAAFSIANNLVFSGVSADPTRAPSFNTEPIGRIRAGQVLTIPLASPLPEGGPFSVALVSDPQRNELRTIGGESRFVGSFDFSFRVVTRDGVRPVVSRIVTSNAEVTSLSALQTLAGGPVFDLVEPHSPIHLEFSEPMASGIPVLTSPSFPVETTVTVDGVTFRFFVARTPGLSFEEVRSPIIPGTLALASTEDSALMLETTYVIDIPSDTSLGLQTTAATDLSGEPLAAFVDGLARAPLMDFRLTLRSSGVSISVPSPRALVSRANLDDGTVRVAGTAAMHVDAIVVELLSPDGQALTSVPATMTGTTRPIPLIEVRTWEAFLPASAFAEIEDTLRIRARSVAAGGDSVPVLVDTVGPEIRAVTGTLDLFANAADLIQRICVEVAPPGLGVDPADRADLTFGGIVLASNEAPEFFFDGGAQIGTSPKFGFCFRDVDVTGLLGVGRHTLRVNAFDVLGNVSIADVEVRVHPWLSSVTPDLVRIAPSTPREILLRGVELNGFNSDAGDVVRVDGRDLPGPVSVVKIFNDLFPDLPPRFALRTTLPDTVSPGPITVLIQGLESNRLSFDVCRALAPKFVSERPFGPSPFLGARFAMERGPLGEPVFAWIESEAVHMTRWNGATFETLPSIAAPGAFPGNPIQLVATPGALPLPVWLSGTLDDPTAEKFVKTPAGSIAIPGTALRPRSLDVVRDPSSGLLTALVVSRLASEDQVPFALAVPIEPPTGEDPAPPDLARVDLVTFTGSGGSVLQIAEFVASLRYGGALTLSPNGTGWILAAGSSGTRTFRRSGGTWTFKGELASRFAVDAAVSPDGSGFHAVSYGDAAFHYLAASASAQQWTETWSLPMARDPLAFNPPPFDVIVRRNDEAQLNGLASIRVAFDGTPRIAFYDIERRTLRYLLGTPDATTEPDTLDINATIGLLPQIALDGNGEALVGYLDFSQAESFLSGRRSAQILFIDTRNRNSVIPVAGDEASRCDPGIFRRRTIETESWSAVREAQVNRWGLNLTQLPTAFCAPHPDVPPLTANEARLCALQGTAAIASRLLDGQLTFRTHTIDPGDEVLGTVDASLDAQDPDEHLGLRGYIGTRAVTVTRIQRPDEQEDPVNGRTGALRDLQIARFQPSVAVEGCSSRPSPRTSAAVVHDPMTGAIVMFGGRNPGGSRLGDTWILARTSESGPECWHSVSSSPSPDPREGHSMAPRPGGGIVLFGGEGSSGLLADLWVFVPQITASGVGGTWNSPELLSSSPPPARRDAAVVYDLGGATWLFGGEGNGGVALGDLWSLETDFILDPLDGAPVWTERFDGGELPDARASASLVAVPASAGGSVDRLVLFGGRTTGLPGLPARNDVFALDLASLTWEMLFANSEPNLTDTPYFGRPRNAASLAFSPSWGTLASMIGLAEYRGHLRNLPGAPFPRTQVASNSIDSFDLSTRQWQASPRLVRPIPREDHASAYDSVRDRVVVFGGANPAGQVLNDTVAFEFFGTPADIEKQGEWVQVVPGTVEPTDVFVTGLLLGGARQFARTDTAALTQAPEVSALLEPLTGQGQFAPFGNSPAAEIVFEITNVRVGPDQFSELLEVVPEPNTQGILRSQIRFDLSATGHVRSHGTTLAELQISANTNQRCTAVLNGNGSNGLRVSASVLPALDHRGPSQSELSESPELASQTFTSFSSVRVDSRATEPRLCARIIVVEKIFGEEVRVLLDDIAAAALVGISQNTLRTSLALIGGRIVTEILNVGLPVDVETPPLGFLGPIADAILLDAFSYDGSLTGVPDPDLEDLSNGRFQAISTKLDPADKPEWLFVGPDQVILSVRARSPLQLPGPPLSLSSP